ncbi:MAG: disulfide bond formation protein B [Betaproteobacteria bacterium]
MRFSSRSVFFSLAVSALALLGAGLLLGEWLRLQPCYLCNFQRFLYLVLAFFALCGALIPGWRRLWSGLIGLTALGGVITAGQQSWMQYAPQLVTECGFGEPTLLEQIVNWLSLKWPAMFMVTGFCTNKEWVFLGFSLANWSAVCFLILLAVAVALFFRRKSRR